MMNKKNFFITTLCGYILIINSCNEPKYYTLVPQQDLERGATPPPALTSDFSSSTESLPDRDELFSPVERPVSPEYLIQRRPLNRLEIIFRVTKYSIGSLICAGIGVGSYFLAANINHEEDHINDFLIGYNQSLTAITNDINGLYNITEEILRKLSGL